MAATQFTIRRKILTIFGAKFHIYNAEGSLLGFCKQKAFKLKEDIRIYTDESATEERLLIKARSMLDISTAFDVVDSKSNRKIGVLQRRGFKSIVRDEWIVLDENESPIGKIVEDSVLMALVRRYVLNIFPQTFQLKDNDGQDLAQLRTHFNPFVHRMTVDVYDDCPLHPFLVLAAGILLVAVEGRQN
jgi:uncharacterized protein YxjI